MEGASGPVPSFSLLFGQCCRTRVRQLMVETKRIQHPKKTYMHVYMHVHTHVLLHVDVRVHVHIDSHIYKDMNISIYIYDYIPVCMSVCTCRYVYIHV